MSAGLPERGIGRGPARRDAEAAEAARVFAEARRAEGASVA